MAESKNKGFLAIYTIIKKSLQSKDLDCTKGSIRLSIILLAIPMVLETALESIFALVDLYFVGHLEHSSYAIQTVGLTESILTLVYAISIGVSISATAIIARRIGEKDPISAAKSGMQSILLGLFISLGISIIGIFYAREILELMGATSEAAAYGTRFTQITMGSSFIIMLLFLINGIFRGAGNAAIAMKSLWIANSINIILCPILIYGWGPIPEMGLIGAALATTIGRSSAVFYQIWFLFKGKGILKIVFSYFKPDWFQLQAITKIAIPAILQYMIGSCSWILLAQLVAKTAGDHASAGYQIALRLMMFFLLPAWGLSNAAATLVGQNIGAKQLDRAEKSVLKTAKYNAIFMFSVSLISLSLAEILVSFFTNSIEVQTFAVRAVRILASGYIFYGIGMVMMSALNGAGDTKTPTWVNLLGFWVLQIPLAYTLTNYFKMGTNGVFIAIPSSETIIAITTFILFKKGYWKKIQL